MSSNTNHQWFDAARRGDARTLQRLLAAGAAVDAEHRSGATALVLLVRALKPTPITAAGSALAGAGFALLVWAVVRRAALLGSLVALLVGGVLLWRFLRRRARLRAVRVLLGAGAKSDEALLHAVEQQQRRLFLFMRAAGADADGALRLATQRSSRRAINFLYEYGARVNAADEGGWTPLLLATREGYADIAKKLLKWGADADAVTR
ncbi:MAG: ankyrin repeat domain-containing protein, partial [Ottowia sp.]|nr:ankyrin repeat domain-containing protein [Ottowia sp.]